MSLEDLVGRTAERRFVVDAELVGRFADIARDHNPLHLDESSSRAGRFGAPVAHGMLVASFLSGLLGEDLPGPGTIYLSQTLAFKRPVFVGQEVTAHVSVLEVDAERRRVHLDTRVVVGDQDCVVGEAWVLWDDGE